jgi:hypothetical protein
MYELNHHGPRAAVSLIVSVIPDVWGHLTLCGDSALEQSVSLAINFAPDRSPMVTRCQQGPRWQPSAALTGILAVYS